MITPKLNLSQFNVFIGETGAIDAYPENLVASTFLYHLDAPESKIDTAIDELCWQRKKEVSKVLGAIGFNPNIVEKGSRRNRPERLACLYLSVVASDFLSQIVGFKDFGVFFDPRQGRKLTEALIKLAKTYDVIVFLSTQNVGCLDALNLEDNDQRLFVVNYNTEGVPIAHQKKSPKPLEGQESVRLSEAYLRGYLGGLSKAF